MRKFPLKTITNMSPTLLMRLNEDYKFTLQELNLTPTEPVKILLESHLLMQLIAERMDISLQQFQRLLLRVLDEG